MWFFKVLPYLPPESSRNFVADVPDNFKKWHNANAHKFENWKRKPSFLEENKKFTKEPTKIKGNVTKDGKKEVLEINPIVFKLNQSKNPKTENKNGLPHRYKDVSFKDFYEGKNGGKVEIFTEGKQNKTEQSKNENALKILADNGRKYRLLPVIEDGDKNPDAFNLVSNKMVDLKITSSSNGKSVVQNALKEANKQGVNEVIIHFNSELKSNRDVFDIIKSTFKQGRAKNIENIIFIMPNNRVLEVDTKRFK